MPRYLVIPEDIIFVDREKNPILGQDGIIKKASFEGFYVNQLSLDPRFLTTKGARTFYKFDRAYDEAKVSDRIMVLDEDVWKEFKEAVETPRYVVPGGYAQPVDGFAGVNAITLVQMLPFIDAIELATDKKPSLKIVENVEAKG